MRIESSVTSLSWIPSGAVEGMTRVPFDTGLAHYDQPPPDELHDLAALRDADRFRFANQLRAWIEVTGGRITAHGQSGGGMIGSTRIALGSRGITFSAVPFSDLRPEPEVVADRVRFVQTAGGRTGVPAPRRVSRPPFVQLAAPTAWSTLALTIATDGSSSWELVGASPFPRHWIYDGDGRLAGKSGLVDFEGWYRTAFGRRTPWGGGDSPALVAEAASALERRISEELLGGTGRAATRRIERGDALVTQGEAGADLFILLDGVLSVEVDGEAVAEVGPGAMLGERAVIEGGRRTSTLRAVTRCRAAVIDPDRVSREVLTELAGGHRRESSP